MSHCSVRTGCAAALLLYALVAAAPPARGQSPAPARGRTSAPPAEAAPAPSSEAARAPSSEAAPAPSPTDETIAQKIAVRWKLSGITSWPPAADAEHAYLTVGDEVVAVELASGNERWRHRAQGLRAGAGVVAIHNDTVLVLSSAAVLRLRAEDGTLLGKLAVNEPRRLLSSGEATFVSTEEAVLQLDASGAKVAARAKGRRGTLRKAEGSHVVLYQHRPDVPPKESPKRLVVVDLTTNTVTYSFKLLPKGRHRVAHLRDGKLAFIDYTRQENGANPTKLFYTEADYRAGKKIRDIALSRYYTHKAADRFWITTDDRAVYVGNHGPKEVPTQLFAFSPSAKKSLWTRTGKVAGMGLLLHQGLLWTGIGAAAAGQASLALAYSPQDGDTVHKIPLPGPPRSYPVAAADSVLYRLEDAVVCVGPARPSAPPRAAQAEAPAQAPALTVPTAAPGWRLYVDRKVGYAIQLPKAWTFKREAFRNHGGVRTVSPFILTGAVSGQKRTLGTVQVLTWSWGASEPDAAAVCQAVLDQRRKLDPRVKVLKLDRVKTPGSGRAAVVASYLVRNRQGYPIKLRSLCMAHHGVAFEVRSFASAHQARRVWQDIRQIYEKFQPLTPQAPKDGAQRLR